MMLSVDALWQLLDAAATPLAPQPVPLAEAAGLVLAQPLRADADQPEFDRSAMDGFAIAHAAGPGTFRVAGQTLPGEAAPAAPPSAGEAWRIYTGSALAPGVRVVKQEEATLEGEQLHIAQISGPDHVRRRGSAVRNGAELLPAGCVLTPARLAIAAGAGCVEPLVIPRPRVVHLTTGSEIVPPHAQPGPGQIRDTNGPLIAALLAEAGVPLAARAHATESVEEGLATLRAMGEADLLLISGGASVGQYDGSAALLEALGYTLRCRAVASRPGKPLLFATRGRQLAFGVPGNPVSHFVVFALFIRRVLAALLGQPRPALLSAVLEPGAPLVADARETFWPAHATPTTHGWRATPLPWLDSGHLAALSGVNALLRLAPGTPPPQPGEVAPFLPCGPLAL